tara:strand:- start:125 stop:262 length:138 start_codon:yes stop_codon:yes gene_type:complete
VVGEVVVTFRFEQIMEISCAIERKERRDEETRDEERRDEERRETV